MEWIMWVDNDTLFGMMDRIIPFMRYTNKDLVVWANYPDEITQRFDANGVYYNNLLYLCVCLFTSNSNHHQGSTRGYC